MSDDLADAYIAALVGLSRRGPRHLHSVASSYADDDGLRDGGAMLAHLRVQGQTIRSVSNSRIRWRSGTTPILTPLGQLNGSEHC